MIKRKPKNPKALAAAVAGLLALAAFGWFVLVSPQRSRAAELSEEIAATEQQLAQARIASRRPVDDVRVDEVFRLTKAMPVDPDIAGVMLELSRIASFTVSWFYSI